MNLRTAKPLHSVLRVSLIGLILCVLAGAFGASRTRMRAQSAAAGPDLVVHEWGTFTSVAGSDGKAVEWSPLGDWPPAPDLPGFVENFFLAFKAGLRGTIRMETPVIYFYSPHELTVSVNVAFSKGWITEWYPHANNPSSTADIDRMSLYSNPASGTISWNSVHLQPGTNPDFPRDQEDRPYYEARQTSAVPVSVDAPKGEQHEKFLFYRGVSSSSLPISAQLAPSGKLLVSNLENEEIPSLILFERQGEKIGYRISSGLQSEAVMDPPEMTASLESLYADVEQILFEQGLYRDEAHAMVQTWRNSWFEEGSRLFYIVPAAFVNAILPLNITPVPWSTVRVFVGRMELVTPATLKAVQTALASHDHETLAKYGHFLDPILKAMMNKDSSNQKYIEELMDSRDFSEAPAVVKRQVVAALELDR